jgi:serine/threonine protein kinase
MKLKSIFATDSDQHLGAVGGDRKYGLESAKSSGGPSDAFDRESRRHPPEHSRSIGRFQLTAKLGAGGMGEVYRATDAKLGRTVAIKLLPQPLAGDRDRLEQFEREARAASALNHPNLITIFDAGVEDGIAWIAMEFVDGATLRSRIADGGLNEHDVVSIATQLAEGLATAHEAGIVHRDLKPENVMLTASGLVKILDFGVAKLMTAEDADRNSADATQFMTTAGGMVGTPGYMAPEQITGAVVDHRADQFALGVMLYEMIGGANPFRRSTAARTFSAILQSVPTLPPSLGRAVPPQVVKVMARCLAKDPADRFPLTRHLADALRQPAETTRTRRPAPSVWIVLAAAAALAAADLMRYLAKPKAQPWRQWSPTVRR